MNILAALYVFMLQSVHYSVCTSLESTISQYFESGPYYDLNSKWLNYKATFESTISKALQYGYSKETVNMFVPFPKNSLTISSGFHVSDRIVDVLCKTMKCREIPRLRYPKVNFDLASNYIMVEASVAKMFLETNYILFRNKTSMLEQGDLQDPLKTSPFAFQQVQEQGHLTIILDDCIFRGGALVTLLGSSVAVGDNDFKLSDCKFNIEAGTNKSTKHKPFCRNISTPGLGSPPVIAPYFSDKKRAELMQLVDIPLRDLLIQKLQGSLFSLLNTSAIVGNKLPRIRSNQASLIKTTEDYLTRAVGILNRMTISKNQGVVHLPSLRVAHENQELCKHVSFNIALSGVTLNGLESAYSSNAGGPYAYVLPKLIETIRFNSLQVRGKLEYANSSNSHSGKYDFNAYVSDVSINILLNVTDGKIKLNSYTFTGWRSSELSFLNIVTDKELREITDAVISAYLSAQIPKKLCQYVPKAFADALTQVKSEDFIDTLQDVSKSPAFKGEDSEKLSASKGKDSGELDNNHNITPDDRIVPDENNPPYHENGVFENEDSSSKNGDKDTDTILPDAVEPDENNPPYHENEGPSVNKNDASSPKNENGKKDSDTILPDAVEPDENNPPYHENEGPSVNKNDALSPKNGNEQDENNVNTPKNKVQLNHVIKNAYAYDEDAEADEETPLMEVDGNQEASLDDSASIVVVNDDGKTRRKHSPSNRVRMAKKFNVGRYRKMTAGKSKNWVVSQSEEDANVDHHLSRSPNFQGGPKKG